MNNYTSFHITITSGNLSRSISNRVGFISTNTLSKIISLMPKKNIIFFPNSFSKHYSTMKSYFDQKSKKLNVIPLFSLKMLFWLQTGKNFKTNRIEVRFCSNLKHNSFITLQTYSKFTLSQLGHHLFIFLKIYLLSK